MDEASFDSLAALVFRRLVGALDAADPDLLEADATSDMVTVTAAGGEKVIVNTQRAVRQIWVAGGGEGVHFSFDPAKGWLDDRGRGLELFAFVGRCVRLASGVELSL